MDEIFLRLNCNCCGGSNKLNSLTIKYFESFTYTCYQLKNNINLTNLSIQSLTRIFYLFIITVTKIKCVSRNDVVFIL